MEARAWDLAARQRRTEAFEAFDRYVSTRTQPHVAAAYWQWLITTKREEEDHVSTWKAERRARLRRQQEAEEEQIRAQLERGLEEARDRRKAEVAALQATRARWEEARRAEERAAAGLVLVEEQPQDQ